MGFRATVVGSYPRIDDTSDGQRLRRAIARWERGEIGEEELRREQASVVREVVQEQAAHGIDVVTDGQVTWYDALSHFAGNLDGFEITGLVRYFDTNTYYRQPRVVGSVQWTRPITVADWKVASGASPAPVKAVLTGPYTLAALSAGAAGDGLLMDLAVALGQEVEALVAAGATHIQIDEPGFVRLEALPKGYNHLAGLLLKGRGRAETTLFTYFGGVAPLLEDLLMLPFDAIGLDLVQGAETLAALRAVETDKGIAFGLVDARNTKRDDVEAISRTIRSLADRVALERSFVAPSNGLEFLPRAKAREKLRVVSAVAARVREAS